MSNLQLFFMICIVPFFIAYLWHVVDWKIQEQTNKNIYKVVTFTLFILLSKIYIETVIKVMF